MINLNERRLLNSDQNNNSLKRSLSHYSVLNSKTLPLFKHNKHLIRSTSIEQIKPIVHYSTLRAGHSNRKNRNFKDNTNKFAISKDQLIMSRPSSSTNGTYSLVDPNKIHLFVKVFQALISFLFQKMQKIISHQKFRLVKMASEY